jgi:hypothetical protein
VEADLSAEETVSVVRSADLKGLLKNHITSTSGRPGAFTSVREANMRNIFLMIVAITALTVLGMAGAETQRAGPQHNADMSMMQNCPMKLPGTDLSVTDADNGIVLTMTTKSGDVAELRRRAESMAKMHSTPTHGAMHTNMMPFSVKYEEVLNGARLTLTPKDPAQLDAFRTKVRQHAEQMKKGECSMMQGMMQGMMDGMKNSEPTPKPQPKAKAEEEDHDAHHPPGEEK